LLGTPPPKQKKNTGPVWVTYNMKEKKQKKVQLQEMEMLQK
jgi:hypothetical protein